MKGIYVLIISISKDITINVGALHNVSLPKGLYAYVGSAQTGLEKRIERHLRRGKQKFWHIDYLLDRREAQVLKVFYKEAERLSECRTANEMAEKGIPIKGFGSSDCRCKSHLFKIETYDHLSRVMSEMRVDQAGRVI
jgi:Uri superfamily endonuclease